MDEKDFYWLVGILEGEGSFMKGSPSAPNRIKISVQMTDEDVIAKIGNLFNKKYVKNPPKFEGHKESYTFCLTDTRAFELMKQMHPFMSLRRKEQIKKALDSYDVTLRTKHHTNKNKLTESVLNSAVTELKTKSLRKVAEHLGVHHESLRRELIKQDLYTS